MNIKSGYKKIINVRILLILVLSLGAAFIILPFIWMVSTSFKIPSQTISYPPTLIPRPPTLEYYNRILTEVPFVRWFFNSAYISTTVTLFILLSSSLVGYVFAKFKFFGKNLFFLIILATMMIPLPVTMIPLYLIISKLGWVDSSLALIIPGLYNAFGIFLMRQFMFAIPRELGEAATIDGCSEFRIFWSVILPQCKSALAALGILVFMGKWNDFLWPLIVFQSEKKLTLPVGLAMFSAQEWWADYGLIMAGAAITVVPVLIVFLIFQRHFIQGIALTGMKT